MTDGPKPTGHDRLRNPSLINGVKRVLVCGPVWPPCRFGRLIFCLLQVSPEMVRLGEPRLDHKNLGRHPRRLRTLIVHAGGDSKRLPPYGPCGKIFVPVPGELGGALGTTLFDRLIPTYLRLPRLASGGGQVVVASGDVCGFDAEDVVSPARISGVGVYPRLRQEPGVIVVRRMVGSAGSFQNPQSRSRWGPVRSVAWPGGPQHQDLVSDPRRPFSFSPL
jgi:hypothetical protein